jgi:hypothetical protein
LFVMIDPNDKEVLDIDILTDEVRISEPYETYK